MNCPHSSLTSTKCQWKIQNFHIASFTSEHTCMQERQTRVRVCLTSKESWRIFHRYRPALTVCGPILETASDLPMLGRSEMTFQASRNAQRGSSSFLTRTFALIGPLWDVHVGSSVDADGAIRDPGLVNTSFHPLHDKIQQDVDSLANILPVGSACLKVWNSAPGRNTLKIKKRLQKQSNN